MASGALGRPSLSPWVPAIVLVTHKDDIAQFAKRVIVFRDGTIRKDEAVPTRPRAADVLKTLPTLED